MRTGDAWLGARRLEDETNDLLGRPVGDAEIDAGNRDEAEHDRCGLRDVAAIRPLYPLELGPACAQEGEGTAVDGLGGPASDGRTLGSGAIAKRFLG
jgi:hypothetical protein